MEVGWVRVWGGRRLVEILERVTAKKKSNKSWRANVHLCSSTRNSPTAMGVRRFSFQPSVYSVQELIFLCFTSPASHP